MAKWYGKIWYCETTETTPGVWVEQLKDHCYYGDLTKNTRKLESSDKVNDDVNINNILSIVADPYAIDHFYAMRCAEIYGTKWKITNVEVQYPRLILTLGGLYNGEQTGSAD